VRDSILRTPLMWAAFCGKLDTLEFFCQYTENYSNEKDQYRGTPVGLAACGGHVEIVQRLLKKGFCADYRDYRGRSPLWYAAHGGHVEIMKLLDQNAFFSTDGKDNNGITPLAEACRQGHVRVVQYLLKLNTFNLCGQPISKRVNVRSRDDDGKTPIVHAVESGSLDCVRAL
ncbi:ankyrin, partial [Amniculicola lignicola CBS 123094]